MQHVNSTGLKQERARTWDRVLVRFSMPALEKLYDISSKVECYTAVGVIFSCDVNALLIPKEVDQQRLVDLLSTSVHSTLID